MLSLMQILIMVAIAIHALAAFFWMSVSSIASRNGQVGKMMFPRQMGAATMAVLTGGFLWSQLHTGGFGAYEIILAAGALCAVIAAGIQGAVVGKARRIIRAGGDETAATQTISRANGLASGLLALCLICMVIARFA